MIRGAIPVLSCEEAAEFERHLLGNDDGKIWEAMSGVGREMGLAIMRDFREIGKFPEDPEVLILIGKGHNAGDALLAGAEIMKEYPLGRVDVLYCLAEERLRPLVYRALEELGAHNEVTIGEVLAKEYDICIGGIFGMSFKPPVGEDVERIIGKINEHSAIKFRAAVDIPSGGVLRADFTYATGVVKKPLFEEDLKGVVGRIRFIDLGFFKGGYEEKKEDREYFLTGEVLAPLRALRKSDTNKRSYGHLAIMSGSQNYPGALIMSVKGALQAGVGLLTVFAPKSIAGHLAVEIPEAMWVACPETEDGSLAAGSLELFLERSGKFTAVLSGPGLGDNVETVSLIEEMVKQSGLPFVLDASALRPSIIEAVSKRGDGFGGVIVTPHEGEYERIAGGKGLKEWNELTGITTLLKGACSKIVDRGIIYYSTFGGPVLARGGSGDVLSGMIGSLLAQEPGSTLDALCRAVVWQGMGADALARGRGQVSSRTTDILDYLGVVLRGEEV